MADRHRSATIVFGGQYQVSQTFRTAMDGDLMAVGLPLYCNGGGVHVEIRGVTGGLPNGTLIMWQDIPAANVQTFAPYAPYHRLLRFDLRCSSRRIQTPRSY